MKEHPPIVVTGAAGFIGRRVVARLAAAGYRVWAADRVPDPGRWPAGVEYRQVDLERELIAGEGDWLLVHLAWSMERADERAQAASVVLFARLLGQMGLRGVVGLGSAEEYGEREGCLREDMGPGNRLSAYGRAKYEACRALESWAQQGAARKAIWLRPFIVYGPGQGGNMAIPYALRCARERIPAEFSAGLQSRDFIHVDDVAEGIAQAAMRLMARKEPWLVCNLGRGMPVRLRDVLEKMADVMAAREIFKFGARPMRVNEPQEQYADVTAARLGLAWEARIPWPEGIDAVCREGRA